MDIDNKNLVVGLIADHLRYARLVTGLENTGIISLSEHPQVGKAIMKLMGIKSKLAYMYYLSLVDDSCNRCDDLEQDAEDLFGDLLWMKKELDKVKV